MESLNPSSFCALFFCLMFFVSLFTICCYFRVVLWMIVMLKFLLLGFLIEALSFGSILTETSVGVSKILYKLYHIYSLKCIYKVTLQSAVACLPKAEALAIYIDTFLDIISVLSIPSFRGNLPSITAILTSLQASTMFVVAITPIQTYS